MVRWLIALLLLGACTHARTSGDEAAPRAAIEAAMADSAAGWNSGSLDRFLAVYADAPSTSFTGARGIARGLGEVRASYIRGYPALFGPQAGGPQPKLSFAFEDFRMLGRDYALLIARWRLDTPGEPEPKQGLTSLVFHRTSAGWKIIADHSS